MLTPNWQAVLHLCSVSEESIHFPGLDRVNWKTVLAYLRKHEVEGFAYRKAKAGWLPHEVEDHLRHTYLGTVAQNLYLFHHMQQVAELFREGGIPFVVFKGLAIAATVYGDWGQRMITDVDMLLPGVAVPYATYLLREAGFQQEASGRLSSERKGLQANASGFLLRDEEGKLFMLDLHWSPTPRYFQVRWSTDLLLLRRVEAHLLGFALPVLSDEDHLLMLCVHGCKHEWERLRFVVDVAQMLHRKGGTLDWAYVWEQAEALRITRMVALGIYLAYRLLNAPVASEHIHVFNRYPRLEKAFLLACRRLFREAEDYSPVRMEQFAYHRYIRASLYEALGSWYHLISLALKRRFSPKPCPQLELNETAPASDARAWAAQALPV